jgi:hypothetical protein
VCWRAKVSVRKEEKGAADLRASKRWLRCGVVAGEGSRKALRCEGEDGEYVASTVDSSGVVTAAAAAELALRRCTLRRKLVFVVCLEKVQAALTWLSGRKE